MKKDRKREEEGILARKKGRQRRKPVTKKRKLAYLEIDLFQVLLSRI